MKRAPTPPDPFRFGWRDVQQIGRDGSKQWVQMPLTLDDVLHPQEGDQIPDNNQQCIDGNYLYNVLKLRLADNPRAVVFEDVLIDWDVPGLRDHSPDISVFDGVDDPARNWGKFRLAVEGAQPVLAIEIVSPDAHDRQARDNDVVTKVREYYRAGVPLYVIVDQERVDGPRQLIGYRRGARKYVRMRPNRQGRLLLEPVRLWLGLREERAVCWDADTGKEMGDFTATAQERDAAEEARNAEAQARQAAEAERNAEAQARHAAEAALAEAQARIRELEGRIRS